MSLCNADKIVNYAKSIVAFLSIPKLKDDMVSTSYWSLLVFRNDRNSESFNG